MPVIDKNTNIHFTQTPEQLTNLLKKVRDLTTIDQRIVMRIEENSVLLFSFIGESFKNIHAFKNYIFPTEDVMTIKKGDLSEPIFFISRDGKKLYRILENYLSYKETIDCKISSNDENYVNYISFDNKKLCEKIIGSDPIAIGSQISIDDINFLMNIDNSTFNFRLNKSDFLQIKKRGIIENEPKSVLYINVNNKMLTIGETKWHLNVTEIESEDIIMSFPKAYFNTMNPSDFIEIYIFEEFILCKYDDYNLMILLETTI
jgi:hypothetical protein